MRKKSTLKIQRGRLDEERRKSEESFEYQRVLLIMLPVIMFAVLVIGIYFGYLSYKDNYSNAGVKESQTPLSVEELTDSENSYLLTVVSSANTVDASFVPELNEYNGVEVSYLMVADLNTMLNDAKEDGVNIEVINGYISFEEQKEIYDSSVNRLKKKKKYSTVKAEAAIKKQTPNAGECEQQTGLIVQLGSSSDKKFEKTAEYRWLIKNSVNYGFVLRYPDKENTGGLEFSPDLFRYVGRDHALLMRAYNMNLDEYVHYLQAQ